MDDPRTKFGEMSAVPSDLSSTMKPFESQIDAHMYFGERGVPVPHARLLFKLNDLSVDDARKMLTREGWQERYICRIGPYPDENLFQLAQNMEYLAGIYIDYQTKETSWFTKSDKMQNIPFSSVLPVLYLRQIMQSLVRIWLPEFRRSLMQWVAVVGCFQNEGLLRKLTRRDEERVYGMDFFFNRLTQAFRGRPHGDASDPQVAILNKIRNPEQTMEQVYSLVADMRSNGVLVAQALGKMPALLLRTDKDLKIMGIYYLLFGSSCYRTSCLYWQTHIERCEHAIWCGNRRRRSNGFVSFTE